MGKTKKPSKKFGSFTPKKVVVLNNTRFIHTNMLVRYLLFFSS
jgi:hypothetical protein